MSSLLPDKALSEALNAFGAGGTDVLVVPLGAGNINDTYLVETAGNKVVLQRINPAVFPDPVKIVANFSLVSSHITQAIRSSAEPFLCAQPILTEKGDVCYCDNDGGCWRSQTWVEHVPHSRIHFNHHTARQLGRVLARFHQLTEDIDTGLLATPIPGFHCTPRYLEQFDRERDAWREPITSELTCALEYVRRFRGVAGLLEEAAAKGYLVRRTIHGDPKLDNVIFTEKVGAAGFFDLDTTGPGLIHYDLGDCLRSCCNRAGEDAKSRQDVRFDADICKAVLAGYLEIGGKRLSDEECRLIFDSILVITFELGLRFLTDHLRGNVYFKVRTVSENLFRALGQFRLMESVAEQEKTIRGSITR